MTDTATAQRDALHPLDPLTPAEIEAAVGIIKRSGEVSGDVRFVSVSLDEPDKAALAAHNAGARVPRRAFVNALDIGRQHVVEASVDLDAGVIAAVEFLTGVQPGIVLEEFVMCEETVKADPKWREAVARRGVTAFDRVIVDPWSVGAYGDERYPDKRLARALAYDRESGDDVGYGRPIEGVVALVDLEAMAVLEVIEDEVIPLPPNSGYYTAASVGPLREDLKPLDIVQPDGPSYTVEGNEVAWQRWRFRIGFTPREGLVLHNIAYEDEGRLRPIVARASMSEMLVPYGDPALTQNKKNVFDNGEYGVGRMANSLELGCDCLGTIHYFDAHLCDMAGNPQTIKNAVCMHEEDYGTLWKHTDWRTRHTEVRRSRRLVMSFFATVGNYDYGFFWYFYQSGDIQLELKLTGVLSVGAIAPDTTPKYGTLVSQQLYAPIHQHHFIFRLDMDVDGEGNSIYEVNTVPSPEGPENPYGASFYSEATLLESEKAAARDADARGGRTWAVVNPNVRNALGQPTGYKIYPGADVARPFAAPDSSVMKRGGFIAHTLWTTAYDPKELYASGPYINQHPEPNGLHRWIERDKPLENEDLVVWYNCATHHVPRPEEWPVMPVAYAGFMLKPFGFFARNPAMDVPPPALRHSCCTSRER
ncbi:primary-amine oxidase [Acuticoccus mangrovi]|uniref:Amine oxidase n=1 Tax=Acuticoccus mangrovi TaxID=2796142 RepID=A0A934MHV2_9HYPH|nr:primary-amine oxidase [Acuticoccus mangrovi]MBJ3778078.1 primary-amine oxidase [Acuticoccus mangrovi]